MNEKVIILINDVERWRYSTFEFFFALLYNFCQDYHSYTSGQYRKKAGRQFYCISMISQIKDAGFKFKYDEISWHVNWLNVMNLSIHFILRDQLSKWKPCRMALLNLNNVPGNIISGMNSSELEWLTTESSERISVYEWSVFELSDDFCRCYKWYWI